MTRTVSTSISEGANAVAQAGAEVQRHASPWVERLARLGYAAKGVLYLLVGILAVRAAAGWGGSVGSSRNALSSLSGGTFGTILLWMIAIGLAGYALWQIFRAVLDPEDEGNELKGIATRIGFAVSAIIHASLAVWVFTHLLTSREGGGSGGGSQGLVARVLEWGTAGRIAIAVAAVCIIGFAIQQLIKAWRVDLSDQLSLARMSEGTRKATIVTGRLGLAARGIVFGIIGWFTLQAAWMAASGEAGGLGEALTTVGSFGPVMLGVVAAGLAAYGVFMLIKARYRRISAR